MRTVLLLLAVMCPAHAEEPKVGPKTAEAEKPKQMPADVGTGRVAWFDITTTNLAKSEEFYGKLFGWTFAALGEQAATIVAGGEAIGTLRVADGKISAFNGVVYIQVEDIRQSCANATKLGATLEEGFPFDLPGGIGAIGLIRDPAGHPLGMYSRTPLAAAKAAPAKP